MDAETEREIEELAQKFLRENPPPPLTEEKERALLTLFGPLKVKPVKR